MPTIKFKIENNSVSKRFDLICVDMTDLSRRKIRSIIDVGGAYLNGKRVRVASRLVGTGDIVTLIYNESELNSLKQTSFSITDEDVLYNDQDLIIVNKPAGLCTQATRTQTKNHLLAVVEKYLKLKSLKLVHRLDKDTSGAVILAKSDKVCYEIEKQFREHMVKKVYLAICFGKLLRSPLMEESMLSSIGKDGLVRVVKQGGKLAKTQFKSVSYNPEYNVSLIECHPYTGRSHQIRAHLEHQGLVLVGEKKYGGTLFFKEKQKLLQFCDVQRGMLHAYSIEFVLWGKKIKITSPLHKDFLNLKKSLGL